MAGSFKGKVLLVDDEPIVRRVCQSVLERNNFQTVLAENGAEAVDLYTHSLNEFILVLADIRMPVMDGIEMARRMFALKKHSNVILMTGFSAGSLVPEDLKRLCSMINKPFTPHQLITAVNKCLTYEADRADAANA